MSDRLLVGTRKGVFEISRRAAGWAITRTHFLGEQFTAVLRDPRSGYLYAAQKNEHFGSHLYRSTDDGATFEKCGTPTYPPKPEGLEDIEPMGQRPVPWELKMMWILEAGHDTQPGLLWCGTIPGGLFRSDDHGVTWNLVESLWELRRTSKWFGGGADFPGIHSVCVHPTRPKSLAVGVSCGGVWMSDDLGATWELHGRGQRAEFAPPEQAYDPGMQDPHRMVQSPTNPDRVWIQHHNGIFRSDDGAKNFTEIKELGPSVFGFAVAVHPKDPDTAWFVPAVKDMVRAPVNGHLGVTRTRDGGRSSEFLRAGLPPEHAYDLIYRHGLDVDASGERLAFGSTTGGLWVSESGGASWACVSAHLPPIYCLRFI